VFEVIRFRTFVDCRANFVCKRDQMRTQSVQHSAPMR